MSPQLEARKRYLSNTSATVSPGQLVVMLYDGLMRDLAHAEQAMLNSSYDVAHEKLLNAQAIVMELFASLDRDKWEGGPGLAKLYLFLTTELIDANVARDVTRVRSCIALVEPLRDAWATALAAMNTASTITSVGMGSVA